MTVPPALKLKVCQLVSLTVIEPLTAVGVCGKVAVSLGEGPAGEPLLGIVT